MFSHENTHPTSRPRRRRLPDFGGRPARINLDQIFAVKGHGKLRIRPIRLEDEEEMVRFHGPPLGRKHLPALLRVPRPRSPYHARAARAHLHQHTRLVRRRGGARRCRATGPPPSSPSARLSKTRDPYTASFDTLIIDEEQEPRLAKALLARLIKLARAFRFRLLIGVLLVVDHDNQNLCRRLGFDLQTLPDVGEVRATLEL